MADDLVVAGVQVLDVGIANEAALPRDDVFRQPGHLRDARVKRTCRVAAKRRSGEGGQIIGERKMLGLRQGRGAEGSFPFELGRGQRRQFQRGPERKVVAAELEVAFEHRRDHENAADHDALIVLQRARHLGGAKAAIALAQNVFRRAEAAVLGDVESDHFRHRLGVAVHAPERAAAVGLGRPAPAGADRIDQHQIGEGEPGIRVVNQMDVGAVIAAAEGSDARADQSEVEECGTGAGAAIEYEGQRPSRGIRLRYVGRVEDGGRTLAGLIEQRKRTGGGRIGELAIRSVEAVLSDGIPRQERENAGAALFLSALFRMPGPVARRSAAMLLRGCGRGKRCDCKGDDETVKNTHLCLSLCNSPVRAAVIFIIVR